MIEVLKKLLSLNNDVSEYLINEDTLESTELYYVHEKLETLRATNTSKINVTIYVDHNNFRGDSSFTVYPSDDETIISDKITKAKDIAKLINNPYYDIVKKEEATYISNSNLKDYNYNELGSIIAKDMVSLNTKDCHFNAIEIFLYKESKVVINSKGLNKKEISYRAFIEAIPTFDGIDESVELYEAYRFNEYDSKYLISRMKSKLEDVKARYNAKAPKEKLHCKVMIREEEITQLAFSLASDLNYGSTYNHQNVYNLNDFIQEGSDSLLSIYLTNKIDGKTIEYFDNDGLDLKEVKVIDNGVFKNQYGSNKYAYYSKGNPTGNLNIVRVEATNTYDKIEEDYLDCVSFSGIQVELTTDYIGGEVRLAYLHHSNEIIPITGISISAKLSEVLKNLRASKEKAISDRYEGPKEILFDKFEIL